MACFGISDQLQSFSKTSAEQIGFSVESFVRISLKLNQISQNNSFKEAPSPCSPPASI
jgi:hypothetical protein